MFETWCSNAEHRKRNSRKKEKKRKCEYHKFLNLNSFGAIPTGIATFASIGLASGGGNSNQGLYHDKGPQ